MDKLDGGTCEGTISMIVWNEFVNDARVLKEAQTLQSAGYLVIVHALHTPGVTKEKETLNGGIKIVRVARSPFWKLRKSGKAVGSGWQAKSSGSIKSMSVKTQVLRIAARLWTHTGLLYHLVRSRPDIVHAHDVNTLPTAWIASVMAGVPLVYDAHEISTGREGYSGFRSLVGWVEKRLMPRAVATITTTDARAKFFARAYDIFRPIVLQNRPRYLRGTRSNRLREELDLQEDWPIVIYQGGLQQGRGLERLVSMAQTVAGAYFVFIGGGRLEGLLKVHAAQLGLLNQKVFFIPTVSLADLPKYTASADIGVQPIENTCLNHFTTDSNKLFEYVIAGLSLVTSDLPEIRKVVRENDLGLLVPPGDSRALTLALQTLVDDAPLRERYRKASLAAAKELNWEQQEHKLTELYAKIMR
tara:strand:+ start:114 stop:1358 length:1245 start_codon:yes stop_codon:yes gene_type:complete